MKVFISVLVLILAINSNAYYGRHSTEAQLNFDARIEIDFVSETAIEDILKDKGNKEYVLEEIDAQLQFLLGTFNSESFKKETDDATASISKEYKIKLLSVSKSKKEDHIIVNYNYDGKILVHKDFFEKNADKNLSEIPIKLPVNIHEIYTLGVRQVKVPIDLDKPNGKKEIRDFNLCTDDHYNSEDDLFYFWDPDRINLTGRDFKYPNCPLKNDSENINRLFGSIRKLPSSWQKYPEYDRLYKSGKLKIYVFLGYMNDVENFSKPIGDDYIYEGFEYIKEELERNGYELSEENVNKKFSQSKGFYGTGINTFLKYTRNNIKRDPVTSEEKKSSKELSLDVEINILLSDTAISSKDRTFNHFYNQALMDGDLIVYDGHSGLGANLDLELLEGKLASNKKYQLIFINGCSGYPYFKDMYFDAKKGGSKNLDLILSGISTLSDTVGQNVMGFLEGFINGKTYNASYILKEIEEASFDMNGSYLTGILGEEDNEWIKP